ncbi:MAG: hypothetical protein HY791_30215 [Deltaproteobacteria bacterium]|nr:hypothetical protein [Deltaproteobacteria bacterium]
MKLALLLPEGKRLVTEELIVGSLPRLEPTSWSTLVAPCGFELDTAPLASALDEVIAATAPYAGELDRRFAPIIHRNLPLSRRSASEPGVWRFLAVIVRPELVRHRFEVRSMATMKSRFWSIGTRPDSNTFARLWWIAELSRRDTDYALTERALASQTLANAVFVRSLSSYRPAVAACVQALESDSADVVEDTMRRLSRVLGTQPLEAHTEEELSELVSEVRSAVLADKSRRRAGHAG